MIKNSIIYRSWVGGVVPCERTLTRQTINQSTSSKCERALPNVNSHVQCSGIFLLTSQCFLLVFDVTSSAINGSFSISNAVSSFSSAPPLLLLTLPSSRVCLLFCCVATSSSSTGVGVSDDVKWPSSHATFLTA